MKPGQKVRYSPLERETLGRKARLKTYACQSWPIADARQAQCKRKLRREPMKNLSRWGALLVGVVIAAMPALAQEAKKAVPPKPAPGPSQAVLETWNDVGRKLIAIAEDLPEDKYDYKPNPDSRTFLAQLIHVSASMYYFTDTAQGKKPHLPDDPKREDLHLQTKADVVAFVKKCVQDGADLIKAKGDKGMNESVAAGGPTLTRIGDLAYGLAEHSGEHYGQLVVYYRINGMVPPESRPKK
jgi:hypothetical protein